MHGDCGRNLTNETGYVMDPMFIEASLFVASDPLEIPRSGPSSQVGSIEASSGSHMHGPSFAKVPNVFSAIRNDLALSKDQQSWSVNEISIVSGSSVVVSVNDSSVDIRTDLSLDLLAVIDALVQTVSTMVGPSQHPPIPYNAHMVKNDYYGSS
ncbi:hypothetical protein QYF36_021963 [Acer negundo]|nr:hypothetical protein QYF36_021963 [Acer negundo]